MKFTKLSLVAALVAGSAVFAVDNVKVSGDANLFYSTVDGGTGSGTGMFGKANSSADASLNLNVTADLAKNDVVTISAGAGYTVLSTLGLENNLVSGVWGDAHSASLDNNSSYGAKVHNAGWVNEAWIAATAGKTTVKLGRMELDTPLAFTEKWSIEKNTFEAAVAINQDIPDTTLVAAWVGNGNGTENFGISPTTTLNSLSLTAGGVVNTDGKFQTYGSNGAYAIAAINNSFKPLTVQAWYYNVAKVADAYWLQADLACQKIPGLLAGVQYTGMTLDKDVRAAGAAVGLTEDLKTDAVAGMLGYEMKDVATVKVAYSKVDKKHSAGFNTATNASTAQSKLYTEAWWNYGRVTQADATSYNVTIESPVNGLFDLGIYYTNVNQKVLSSTATTNATYGDNDLSEIAVTVGKSYGPADITLAYINAKAKTGYTANDDETSNTVQAYLTVNF